jgi:hypothetical protein
MWRINRKGAIGMAVNHQQKQRGRGPGRPFTRGVSGNPAGRPVGSRNAATEIAQALLDGEADALVRKCVELALEGNPAAMKLCVERLVPRRGRSVRLAMPPIASAADIAPAMGAIASAAAEGAITPYDGAELARIVESCVRALEVADFERRLKELEDAKGEGGHAARA